MFVVVCWIILDDDNEDLGPRKVETFSNLKPEFKIIIGCFWLSLAVVIVDFAVWFDDLLSLLLLVNREISLKDFL